MRTAAITCALLLAAGCTSDTPTDIDGGGTPEDPAIARATPYQLRTTVAITAEVVLPAQLADIVATLRAFSTNPARAMFDLAEARGVPAVAAIRAALPGVLEDRLEGWINGYIADVEINGTPITTYAAQIAALAELALTRFAVTSELVLDRNDTATHRLTGVDLAPAGFDASAPIGGFSGDVLTQTPPLLVGPGGALDLGNQQFGLNYGEYAWIAIEVASTKLFGAGVRASLGTAVDCPALARTIATRCVLDACVGHQPELTAICNGGLDAVVDIAHEKLGALRFDILRLATGAATLVDRDGDGTGDAIVDGVWQAHLDVGGGPRMAPATFTGAR